MTYPRISSTTHETVKAIVRLHTARERKRLGLFIIEGCMR